MNKADLIGFCVLATVLLLCLYTLFINSAFFDGAYRKGYLCGIGQTQFCEMNEPKRKDDKS